MPPKFIDRFIGPRQPEAPRVPDASLEHMRRTYFRHQAEVEGEVSHRFPDEEDRFDGLAEILKNDSIVSPEITSKILAHFLIIEFREAAYPVESADFRIRPPKPLDDAQINVINRFGETMESGLAIKKWQSERKRNVIKPSAHEPFSPELVALTIVRIVSEYYYPSFTDEMLNEVAKNLQAFPN